MWIIDRFISIIFENYIDYFIFVMYNKGNKNSAGGAVEMSAAEIRPFDLT